MTIETFDQSDEETWPDQQKDNYKDKDNDKDKDIVTFETLITFLTIENNNLNIQSYPWIKSDRDSIRNSCNVLRWEDSLNVGLSSNFAANAQNVIDVLMEKS